MAESILVTGKKISSMELVTNVIGNEKIPTGQPDDLAVTPDQIADHTIARGDLASQEDLSQVEVSLSTEIDQLSSSVSSENNSIRQALQDEVDARILGDSLLNQKTDLQETMLKDLQDNLNQEIANLREVDDTKVDKEGSVKSVSGRVGDVILTPSDIGYPDLDSLDSRAKQARYIYDSSGRTQQDINNTIVDVRSFGAIGDGTLHKVSEWLIVGSNRYYKSLAEIQVDYPHVTSIDDSIDWAATQKAVNTPNLYKIRMPCIVGLGTYHFGSNELVIPNNKSNLTFIGDGSADAGATVIRSTPNKNGFIAINSKAYATTLQDLALLSTTGNDDGFAAIGFQHMRETTGSTGRLCHQNFRIMGFSKHACKVGQAINYQFDNITFTGGIETLWIGRDASINQRSTTVSMYHAYITGGKRCGVYLDRPSDFMADRLIVESCGKGTNPATGTFYEDAAGLIAIGVGQCQLNAPYFEDNRRNIWSDSSIIIIAPNYGPATLPNVWDFSNPNAADVDKGRIELLRNGIRTRFLRADEYKGYIEVPDEIRFYAEAKYDSDVIAKALYIGSHEKYGRVDGVKSLRISSNMSGTSNVGVVGQEVSFGVTNSAVSTTNSRWITLGHRRLNNTDTALSVYSNSGSTLYSPNGTPVKIAEFNSNLGFIINPKPVANPEVIGDMVFELTNNTTLTVKVRGLDGVSRSGVILLT